jgi:hypothetical protein
LLHEINKFQKELNNLDVKRKIQIETIFQDADLTDEERNKLLKEKEEKEKSISKRNEAMDLIDKKIQEAKKDRNNTQAADNTSVKGYNQQIYIDAYGREMVEDD